MPSMHAPQTKPSFELPAAYGDLVETMQVKGVDDLEGTLFVHLHKGVDGALVASLRLKSGADQVTFKHLWEPKTPHTSGAGSVLLFRNTPNSQRGEDWNSPSFRERRVEVYEGKGGKPFAMIPNGKPVGEDKRNDPRVAIPLERRTAKDRPAFNAAAFRTSASQMRQAVQAARPSAPSPAAESADSGELTALDQATLEAIKENQGDKGARWDDVVGAVQHRTLPAGQAAPEHEDVEGAVNRLMDRGLVYEPTIGILKAT